MNKPGKFARPTVSAHSPWHQSYRCDVEGADDALVIALSLEDVLTLSSKFWKLHAHPVVPRMSGAFTLIGSQYNLVVGTIAPYAKRRPELLPLLQRLIAFEASYVMKYEIQ
jgi:hypothetical protein